MEIYDLIKYVAKIFHNLGIKYFITGSIASIIYGEPRFTIDIDVVANIEEKHIESLLKAFPAEEFYISKEAIFEAILYNSQFNIIQPASGLKVDVIIPKKNKFDENRFQRIKKLYPARDIEANFASPEDVIIMKMKYYKEGESEKHIRDIISMFKISGEQIDREYIKKWTGLMSLEDIWKLIVSKL